MTPHNELRLLPWSAPDGKPCFLSTDAPDSHLSRLADNTEEIQLGLATELLAHAGEVLADPEADPEELHLLATDLTSALHAAIRVANSRGHRLPTLGDPEEPSPFRRPPALY
ncbi:hypothetical protein EF910_05960 [Streptomyces sp. WAC07149]|uniref:hypothetical protein n=1 Tax=Streptomyces sp. WAC07149 TaxID=2487425 RepID=UPI000F77A759|nr:hypothetical protein [Streptomyces sp. WAC07149]RST07232.1 hypothetical protein EF910_05960 [Streptomyces sp. WAC07149]